MLESDEAVLARYLRNCVGYDPDTGVFTGKERPSHHFSHDRHCSAWNSKRAGKPFESLCRYGYVRVSIDGTSYAAHRLAWLLTHGRFPAQQLDHINGDKTDNRIANLREVSHAQNQMNKGVYQKNKTGVKGVRFSKGKYEAQIGHGGEMKYLGRFDTVEEASECYQRAAKEIYGDFART